MKAVIVRTLVDFDFPDLDTVLDMLFTTDNMNANKEVRGETFQQWIIRDVKVPLAERDLLLFMKANPALCRSSGLIDREDLHQILGDSYRQARYEFMERKQYMDLRYANDSLTLDHGVSRDLAYDADGGQRVLNEAYYRDRATTPQFAGDRISGIEAKSDPPGASFVHQYGESFGARARNDTLNQRDTAFKA